MFSIGAVGTGCVGIVTGACLAHLGHQVVCEDKNERRVDELSEGRMPIYEPGLQELVAGSVRRGGLHFSTELAPVVDGADVLYAGHEQVPL